MLAAKKTKRRGTRKPVREAIRNKLFKRAEKEAWNAVSNWRALGGTDEMLQSILESAGAKEDLIRKVMDRKAKGTLTDEFLAGILAGLKFQRMEAESKLLAKSEATAKKMEEIIEKGRAKKKEVKETVSKKLEEIEKKATEKGAAEVKVEGPSPMFIGYHKKLAILIVVLVLLALIVSLLRG